jgi:hypothetical protein
MRTRFAATLFGVGAVEAVMRNWTKAMNEPTLDELLKDDIMLAMVRSSGLDPAALRAMLAELAARLPADRLRPRFGWAEERGFQPSAA